MIPKLLKEAQKIKLFEEIKASKDFDLLVDIIHRTLTTIEGLDEYNKKPPAKLKVKLEGVDIIQIKGDKGDKGDRGMQGIEGLQGERGPQGIQGVQGERGPQGIQGERGLKGDKGERGEKGEKGKDGITYTPERIKQVIKLKIKDIEGLQQALDKKEVVGGVATHGVFGAIAGTGVILTTTSTIDDSNVTFVFSGGVPREVVVNGATYINGSGCTISGGTVTLNNPVGVGGFIYAKT